MNSCNLFQKNQNKIIIINLYLYKIVYSYHIFNHLVKEGEPYYTHIYEGEDDMPSHAKSILSGASVSIPITNGKFNLGTWQGLYLCEFRNRGGNRKLVATILS